MQGPGRGKGAGRKQSWQAALCSAPPGDHKRQGLKGGGSWWAISTTTTPIPTSHHHHQLQPQPQHQPQHQPLHPPCNAQVLGLRQVLRLLLLSLAHIQVIVLVLVCILPVLSLKEGVAGQAELCTHVGYCWMAWTAHSAAAVNALW
jgi:hypothetical protein